MQFAGQYHRRVTIEARATAQDADYGSPVDTWVAVATRIAASVEDVLPSKSEDVRQGLRIATRPARLRIRYRAGITSAMRVIVHGATDRVCQIVAGPAEIGRREALEMMIEEYSA